MKKYLFIFLLSFLEVPVLFAGVYNEPDSAYVFSYSTGRNRDHNGLHFAWSIDQVNWYSIGSEYSFLRSDFGRWGSQKRMLSPLVYRDTIGTWHCFFRVNEELGVLAYAKSTNLVDWLPQSYHYPAHSEAAVSPGQLLPEAEGIKGTDVAIIDGEQQTGMIHQVEWSVIDGMINACRLADYKNRLHGERTAQDSERFAGLKPLEATLTIQPEKSKPISDMLIGIFFEDINYAADGGIYAELVQNRGFEYSPADKNGHDPSWNNKKAWSVRGQGMEFGIDTISPVHSNNRHYATLQSETTGAALVNEGFDGISLIEGDKYYFSVFARMPEKRNGNLKIRLAGRNGENYGEANIRNLTDKWKKYEITIASNSDAADASLEVIPQMTGTVHLDMVSLFPQKTFKGRRNGLRADLAQTLADMKPRFARFPGGCVAHGNGIDNMYRWKNTIGSLEARKPQPNLWGYHQTAGLGYYEYFLFCEDIGAEPLPVLPAGVPCQNSSAGGHGQQCGIPMEQMGEYIQEVLDLIEWANGDPKKTVWGRKRAEAGHPKPFNLKYIGIGNEDLISDVFEERYVMICNAVREKYPEIIVIGTVGPFWEGGDYQEGWRIATEIDLPMVDEHYYNSPGWYIHNQDFYDRYDRSKSKVYLGEYAAHLPGRPNNIETALAEALHLTNIERNGDVVSLTSYAPLLAKEGYTQWKPDLIYFNNTEVKPTVGYYVQQLFGQNSGDEYLPSSFLPNSWNQDIRKRVVSSVVKDSHTGDYIIKFVNFLPVPVKMKIDLSTLSISAENAELTILSGDPGDEKAKPVKSLIQLSGEFTQELPAYSFTVVRIR